MTIHSVIMWAFSRNFKLSFYRIGYRYRPLSIGYWKIGFFGYRCNTSSGFCRRICWWTTVSRSCSSCLLSGSSIRSCRWAAVLHSYIITDGMGYQVSAAIPKQWLRTCSSCLLSGLSMQSHCQATVLNSCSCRLLPGSRRADLRNSASCSRLLSLELTWELG